MTIDQGSLLGGRYAVGALLGRGGMADVFRGEDRTLRRAVAIKVMRGVEAGTTERARFHAEARTLAGLSHPSLVTLLDVGAEDQQPFLVMELVDGPTFADCLGTSLPPSRVASIGGQVAQALAYAHSCGIVHRDVKPGNVLLDGEGRARLADFGVARLVDQATLATQDGMTIGSPAYVAPEQVTGDEVTPAADVYSLGLVLLEALTGRREFPGTPTEAAFARLHRSPEIPDHLPDDWQDLLRAMTARDPEARPTAAEVAQRIPFADASQTASFTQAVPPARSAASSPRPAPAGVLPRSEPRRRRHLRAALVAAAAVAALVFVVALVVLATRSGQEPPRTEPDLPDGVPTRLEQPLTDLHEAVHGRPE